MKKNVTVYCDNEWTENYDTYTVCVEQSTLDLCRKITGEDIYNHLRQAIGVMAPCGITKFIPRLKIGKEISISLQISYYLWSKRLDKSETCEVENSPITQEEFDQIVGTWDSDRFFDVQITIAFSQFQPGQTCISRLVNILHYLGEHCEIRDNGLYDISFNTNNI